MDATVYYRHCPSPLGKLLLTSNGQALTGLYMTKLAEEASLDGTARWEPDDAPFREICRQIEAYFEGHETGFDLPLEPAGTPFQKQVWSDLSTIPYGCAISYAELARRVGRPGASRAVGRANGQNPISLIVPCHRVIGADGTLVGYGGGLDRKRWLLEHEAEVLARRPELVAPAFPAAIVPRMDAAARARRPVTARALAFAFRDDV